MNRRAFLRFGVSGATVLCVLPLESCSDRHPNAQSFELSGRPVATDLSPRPLVWVETGVCTGCGGSLLGSIAPPAEILVPELALAFQPTLMDGSGTKAIDQLLATAGMHSGRLLVVVDGAIPTRDARSMTMLGAGDDGREYSAAELVAELADKAAHVIALGTCASFGGIPGSAPGNGLHVSVAGAIGRVPIRVPGCPPNPAWIATTLMALTRDESIPVDFLGRPSAIFDKTVHDACPRRERFDAHDYAQAPGDPVRCLLNVGCKGRMAHGDCPSRLWHGRSCCIKANQPCMGCTAPGFLDARPAVDGNDVGLEGKAAAPFSLPLEASS